MQAAWQDGYAADWALHVSVLAGQMAAWLLAGFCDTNTMFPPQAGDDSPISQLLRSFHPMQSGYCSLFARKFAPGAAGKLRALASIYISRVAVWEAEHPELKAAAEVRLFATLCCCAWAGRITVSACWCMGPDLQC